MDELVAKEVLNILMESGIYRSEELAMEALENGSEQWLSDLEEEASMAAILSLQEALETALKNRDFEKAKQIRKKIETISKG